MNRKLRFPKNLVKFGLISYVAIEVYSLGRFIQISKAQPVEGTEAGFFGFMKDVSDPQWNYFSDNFQLLVLFQAIFLMGSYMIKAVSHNKTRTLNLQVFNVAVGLCFSFFLHSTGALFQLGMIVFFYYYQKIFQPFKYFSAVLWSLALLALYCNENYQGYQFSWILPQLYILDDIRNHYQLIPWNVLFNLLLLRIISFSQDRNWAINGQKIQHKSQETEGLVSQKTLKDLVKEHHPAHEYTFLGYLAYLYYAPLFFAGPTITYNAYHSQMKVPQQTHSRMQVIKYVLRVYCLDLLTMIIFLHICYPNAIPKLHENQGIWESFSVFDFHIMSVLNLIFLWYKFLCIWRITRAWALMDGIETCENMNRCVFNSINFSGFWRSWHRSFNQWLIRYIYVPLGGSKYKVINMWAVFTFVALWHDFKLDLLLWAWIICLALVPEIAVMSYFNKDYYFRIWWFKYLVAFTASFQMEMMTLANCIGFGSGHEGMAVVIAKWSSLDGILFLGAFMLCRNMPGAWFIIDQRENEELDKNY